jgi:hypothetical protein
MTVAAFVNAFARLSAHLSSSTLTAPSLFADKSIRFMSIFLRANIMWNNIHNPQKYLRFSVTDGIIYLGKHQKYNLLHSIPSTPRVAVPKKRTEDLAMTDYGRTDIFLGESRVNRSALLLQQQVFLHNKINRTIPETGYFCAVPGFLRFKRAVIYGL